ncbi:MAG: GTPase [Candidatus Micrarchaeales archaeon]
MLIGIIGAPNKGKSTLFSAMTMAEAEMADRPFTTIKPNYGVAYIAKECVEGELGVKCKPRNSVCKNGVRYIPINIVDVAGLVPGAHLGKGMGNQFLNDAIKADVLILVVDLTGKTDSNGNPTQDSDPRQEVGMIVDELAQWIAGIIKKHMKELSKEKDVVKGLGSILAGMRITEWEIKNAISLTHKFKEMERAGVTGTHLELLKKLYEDVGNDVRSQGPVDLKELDLDIFAKHLIGLSKPIVIAANKTDATTTDQLEKLKKVTEENYSFPVFGCSAAIELALRKAEKSGLIDYRPGDHDFKIVGNVTEEQKQALTYMKGFISKNGTGVNEMLSSIVFSVFEMIVVYPVEDENKYTDHFGNVLPDAILLPVSSTAEDLASVIHTDLAKNMLYALDARSKRRIGKEQELKDNDVIKIVSAAK